MSQAQLDHRPRFRAETGPHVQERSKTEAGKSSSTGGLGAVALGLAGLSMILGMKRKAQADKARGRCGYISDVSYESYSDSYSGTLRSDSEDDGNFLRDGKRETRTVSNWRNLPGPTYVSQTAYVKDKKGAKDERVRQSDVTSTVPKDSTVQVDLGASQENQRDLPPSTFSMHIWNQRQSLTQSSHVQKA